MLYKIEIDNPDGTVSSVVFDGPAHERGVVSTSILAHCRDLAQRKRPWAIFEFQPTKLNMSGPVAIGTNTLLYSESSSL